MNKNTTIVGNIERQNIGENMITKEGRVNSITEKYLGVNQAFRTPVRVFGFRSEFSGIREFLGFRIGFGYRKKSGSGFGYQNYRFGFGY